MRGSLEAASKTYEKVKKSVQEKWEGFKKKFEGTKSEMAGEVMKANSPEDMIALGKRMIAEGEAMKTEQGEIKSEESGAGAKYETGKKEIVDADHDEADAMNKKFDENKAAEEAAEEKARIAEQDRIAAKKEAAKLAEIRAKINGESVEAVSGAEGIEKTEPVAVENSAVENEKTNIKDLADKYVFNGEAGTLTIKLSETPEELRSNKDFMTNVISRAQESGSVMSYVGENLKNDKEFAKFAMSINETNSYSSGVYEALSPELQNDREIVLAAMDAGTSLDKIPNQFKDKEIVLRYLSERHTKLGETIPSELWEDQDVAEAALKNGIGIQSFPKKYRDDESFMTKAISERPYSYVGASDRLKNNENFAFVAIKGDLEKNRGYSSLPEKLPFELTRNQKFMKKVNDLEKQLRQEDMEKREAAWRASQQKEAA